MNTPTIRTITEVDREAPAPSPFLPGTQVQFAWDSTSLGYLKTCPRLYKYIMLDGWSAKDESVHLRFGQEYHSALEGYQRLRAEDVPHEEALHMTVREVLISSWGWESDRDTKTGKYKNRDTLISLVVDNLDHYEKDAAVVHLLEDGRPAVELSFRFELDWGPQTATLNEDNSPIGEDIGAALQPYLLCGHLDRVVDFQSALFVMDHKTATQTLSDYYFAQFEPNNQMSLYSLAAKIILAAPVRGVIIDGAQILLEDDNRFVRRFTYRTEDQTEEWLADLRYYLQIAEQYATIGYWPQNDTACDKFGGCRFRDICSKSPQVREAFLKSNFNKLEPEERWNPLKPR